MAVRIPDATQLGTRDPRASQQFVGVPVSPVGSAVARAGRAIAGTASVFEAFDQERKKQQAFDTDAQYLKFEQWATGEYERRANEAEPGAPGFTEGFRKDFDKAAQQFYKGVPDEFAPEINRKLVGLSGRITETSTRFERKSRHDYSMVQLADGENALVDRAMSDPSQYQPALEEGRQLIENSSLDAIEKEVRLRQWQERLATADVQRQVSAGEYDKVRAGLRGDPTTIDRIIQIESGGNPNAKNPKSSATGLGQFIDSTWVATVQKHAPQLMEGRSRGEVLALRTDPTIARQMLQAHTDDNAEFLRNRGIETTDGNLYLAHFLGAGGAARVLSEDPNARVEDVLGHQVAAANPFLKGRNVGQLIEWASTKMGEAKPSSPSPNRYDAIPWEGRQALIDKIDAKQKQEFARKEAEFLTGVEDYVAFVRDGNAPTGQFTPEVIAESVSPEKAPQVVEAVQRAEAYGADYASIKWSTPAEIRETVNERMADLSSEDYREDRGDIVGLRTAIEARDKALTADPAKYVLQSEEVGPLFQAAMNAPEDPVAARQYAEATLAEQARLGVPKTQQRIMPAEQVAAVVEQLKTATSEGQNMARSMAVMQEQWGKYWPQVHAEMAGDLPGSAMVIGTMTRPDQQLAAERLAEAAKVGKGEYEKLLEQGERTDLQDQVTSSLAPFLGTLINNPGGMETYGTVAESVYLLALANKAGGDSVSRAVSGAVNDVLNKAYSFEGSYRVPIDFDAGAVRAGTAGVLDRIGEMNIDLPVSLTGLSEDETRAAYTDALKGNGFFVTAPDESGLVLYEGSTRSAVTSNGEPIIFTWEQLTSGSPIPADLGSDVMVTP